MSDVLTTFSGFTAQTMDYFMSIRLDNTKSNFEANRSLYDTHVKAPLRALHGALLPVLLRIDPDICARASRCVSGAYNDFRFSRSNPIKTHLYLHFCAETGRDDDVPGFFMDASPSGYRYGLQLYHRTARGMTALCDAVLEAPERFTSIARDALAGGRFTLEGDVYKKDRHPDAPLPLKDWLNRKTWCICRSQPIDDVFFSPVLADHLSESFEVMASLYRFMVEALCVHH